jgi:predicted Fe-Mo cluster-binding NifX family protein
MRPLTIELDEQKYQALQAIATENGISGAEKLVSQQVDRLISSYCGTGVSAALQEHIRASIAENRGLLERLAQ